MITFFQNYGSGIIYILIYGLAYIMALFVAMPFHEFAHAYVAKKEGDYTAVALKRCTLAPLAHIDVKGLIFLLLFGFGWAKPVPIDERNFKRGKLSKFLVSIAGILMNLVLGIVFLFIYFLIYKISPNFYNSGIYGTLVKMFLSLSVSLNFSFAFFNLLPIYPLDGFRIIETFTGWNNGFILFMKKYSFVIYLVLVFSTVLEIYFNYTAGFLITGLSNLFIKILGV